MKFILGTKQNMTQVFREDGTVVPVTRIQVGPCVITQVRKEKNVNAIQIGFGVQKKFRLNKAKAGHLNNISVNNDNGLTVRFLREFKTGEGVEFNRGDVFDASSFSLGEKVKVIGTSKGRGFQGVVKRHGFHGGHASHGNKDQLRMPGSIGATGPQRVFKGKRMGGHMGDDQVTVKNLEIMKIDSDLNEILIKGAVPGARGGLLLISTDAGEVTIINNKKEEVKPEVVEVVENASEEKTAVDSAPAEVAVAEEIKVEETK
ncbi:MAG TPA: 50S ribosomal protein L3 [Candidatus Magasanikbacteria bacterium]|nr:50S ribosomal protein L3 [Candidatus Magasanikbacteria bacterium]